MINIKRLQKLKEQKEIACQEYDASEARYWLCITMYFPQFADDRFHLESHNGETFIVDEKTGSEIYYLPNGFKL